MASLNRVELIGNLGADPETRSMPTGQLVANIRVATSERWKDKQSGESKERTEWTTVAFFGRQAEIAAEFLKKGSRVYVAGQLRTRKWQDKQGNDRWSTEVIGNELIMLDRAGAREGQDDESRAEYGDNQKRGRTQHEQQTGGKNAGTEKSDEPEFDDDIPF